MQTEAEISNIVAVLEVVCKRVQQLPTIWDLQCIVGRIQPIKLWRPCVLRLRGPSNVGRAVQTDPKLLRYASVITEQKKCWEWVVGSKVWPVSNFAKQLPTTHNNMQQGGKKNAACNIQKCWELLANNVVPVCTRLNNFKTKLGGEICASDLNTHKGYCGTRTLDQFQPELPMCRR